ncbi:hypothetical protein ABW19_dt0206535 [Dactylella cylindrospora]|nr:hypothetical protein ABW19_dt0206535 [Dactylella cylindrospora]
MSPLDDLPIDIKVALMKHMPDLETLLAISLVSRSFNDVFRLYKSTLQKATLANEVHRHRIDTHFIGASYPTCVKMDGTKKQIYGIIDQYIEYMSGRPFHAYQEVDKDGKLGAEVEQNDEVLMLNHLDIRGFCKTFMGLELARRASDAPSGSLAAGERHFYDSAATSFEMERLISASYRLAIVVLLYLNRTVEGELVTWQPSNHVMALLFDTWSYWDFMAVKTVKEFLWEKLLPFATESRKQNWMQEIFVAGPQTMPEHAPKQFSLVLSFAFPMHINSWIRSSNDPVSKMGELRGIYELYYWELLDQTPGPCIELSRIFFDFESKQLWYPYNVRHPENLWPTPPPLRICKRGHEPFRPNQKGGLNSWTVPVPSYDKDRDLTLCIWDDWRLERWGYVMPNFDEDEVLRISFRRRDLGPGSLMTLRLGFGHEDLRYLDTDISDGGAESQSWPV